MFNNGLVVGKFYPPHKGHGFLIDTAKAQSKKVTIIVCHKSSESISGELRVAWLKRIHPECEVLLIKDTKLADDDSEGWAKHTVELLGYVPDAVFTSEDYGDPYAAYMGCAHVRVDKERMRVPISATKIRNNPHKYLHFLEPCVRAHFVRRICVIGAESTGTTTLAQDLAAHYRTAWVPEYGRRFTEEKLRDGLVEWRTEDFVHIARSQNEFEDALAATVDSILICDTDSFATGVWHERYMGMRSSEVEKMSRSNVDLYIVTGDEIPFVQDGTRDGEHIRHQMHARFVERLQEDGKRFSIVRGSREERLKAAVALIDG